MKQSLFSILAGFIISGSVYAQTPKMEFTKTGGSAGREQINTIDTDTAGNFYYAGSYTNTVDFNPGSGNLTYTSKGNADAFIVKLDVFGNFDWAFSFGAAGIDEITDIKTDVGGNIYITGYFSGTVDFNPGAGNNSLTSVNNASFLLKLKNNGDFVWVLPIGGTGDARLAINNTGQIYVATEFIFSPDFDPGSGTTTITSKGNNDIGLSKFNSDGIFIWAKAFGGTDFENVYDITTDKNGNIYLCGNFQGTVDFDPGAGTKTFAAIGTGDAYVLKISTIGNFVWANIYTGSESESIYCLKTDENDNVYFSGTYRGTIDLDPSAGSDLLNNTSVSNSYTDVFLCKINPAGSLLHKGVITGKLDQFLGDIEFTKNKSVIFTGNANSLSDLNPGPDSVKVNFTTINSLILELDTTLKFLRATSILDDDINFPSDCSLDKNGNLLIGGLFKNTVDFDMGASQAEYTSAGDMDFYFTKWSFPKVSVNKVNLTGVKGFPNPTADRYTIQLGQPAKDISVAVYSASGQVVLKTSFNNTATFGLDLYQLNAGVYMVSVEADRKQTILRVLKP